MKILLKTGAAFFAIALLSFVGFTVAHGYGGDQCKVAITPPAGGFAVNNLSGDEVTKQTIKLEFTAGGDASYVEVSNYANFSHSWTYDYQRGATASWTLLSGYGTKSVYVRYLNSCKALPSPTLIVKVKYEKNNVCTIGVKAPTGGFGVKSNSGSSVTDPNIVLGLTGGNASYVEIANNSAFTGSTILPYAATANWTLPTGFGSKTVYVRYLNSCKKLPSAAVSVTVNYSNACSVGPTPNGWFMVTNLTGNNLTARNIKLGMYGGNAAYMEVSNNSNFSDSTMYAYAPTLDWMLSSGYGNKTVWVRYWNSCKKVSSIAVSISVNYVKK